MAIEDKYQVRFYLYTKELIEQLLHCKNLTKLKETKSK